LQYLAEALGAPVSDQELEPRPAAQPAVAVVAEQAGDAGPDRRYLLGADEHAKALRQHRAGRQAAADPEVEPRRPVRAAHADKRAVVDLVCGALRAAA